MIIVIGRLGQMDFFILPACFMLKRIGYMPGAARFCCTHKSILSFTVSFLRMEPTFPKELIVSKSATTGLLSSGKSGILRLHLNIILCLKTASKHNIMPSV